MNKSTVSFYIETLGCPRNDSDSEAIINFLKCANLKQVNSPEEASHIIINGCAFIEKAVSESIDRILILSKRNPESTLLVVGCLAERYKKDLKKSLPEVDLLVGTGSIDKIEVAIRENKSILSSNKGFIGKNIYKEHHTTPHHYRYIKVQEGCNYECSFCIIPKLKGAVHSKPLGDIEEEIRNLPKEVREIILVGQDTSSWGQDIYGKPSLDYLLNEISPLFPHWIRILYLHPLTISESLLRTIASQPNLLNYLDIPLQHISSRVLNSMKRGYDKKFIEKLLSKIQNIDNFTLRTSFIVGFPEETEEDFNELYDFVRDSKFDRVGLFTYSHEEGTDAYSLKELNKEITRRRFKRLFTLIQQKMTKSNKEIVGKKIKMLIDGMEGGEYHGRTMSDAPDIDQIIWIRGNRNTKVGDLCTVKITDSLESELMGELL